VEFWPEKKWEHEKTEYGDWETGEWSVGVFFEIRHQAVRGGANTGSK